MKGPSCIILLYALIYTALASREKRAGSTPQIATTIEEAPYVQQKTSGSGNNRYEGYIPDLMKAIAKKVDIKYEFKVVPDGKYGMNQGSTWNGMVGEVINNRARFAAAPITVSDSRRRVVDFTNSIMNIGKTILIKKPLEGEPPISNAQQLADQSKIEYGVIQDGETHKFFQSSQNPTYSKMWNHMRDNSDLLVASNKAGVDKVLSSDGTFAFIMENSTASYWVNKKPCDLMTVGGNLDGGDNSYAFALRRNDALKSQFDNALRELQDDGTVERLQKKWWPTAECAACKCGTTTLIAVLLSVVGAFTATKLI